MAKKSNSSSDLNAGRAQAAVNTSTAARHRTANAVPAESVPETRNNLNQSEPAAAAPAPSAPVNHEDIARLAFFLWESRGCQGGTPEEDWFQAERELLASARPTGRV